MGSPFYMDQATLHVAQGAKSPLAATSCPRSIWGLQSAASVRNQECRLQHTVAFSSVTVGHVWNVADAHRTWRWK